MSIHLLVVLSFVVRFEIATHVTNTSVIQNNNAFLSCEFYGTEIINITWTTSDRSAITSDASHVTIISSSSSTRSSSSLQFTNVDKAQSEGWYTCTAYSYNGSSQNIIMLSSGAYLYVQGTYCIYFCVMLLLCKTIFHCEYIFKSVLQHCSYTLYILTKFK